MGRLIWGVLLVAAGALFLAVNAGWVDWGFVISLWQLWPLLLVAAGINLILGERNQTLATGLIVLVVLGGIAFAWVYWDQGAGARFGTGPLAAHQIDQPASAQVRSARVALDTGAAQVLVHELGAGGGSRLVEGTYLTRGEPTITQQIENGVYSLDISQRSRFGVWPWAGGSSGRERLDLGLAGDIPWTLDLNAGATRTEIDLSQVLLQELTIDAGASSITVVVGDVTPDGRIEIKGGAGSYRVTLPRDRRVQLELESSVSSRNLDPAFESTGDNTWASPGAGPPIAVRIEASVSSVRVDLE